MAKKEFPITEDDLNTVMEGLYSFQDEFAPSKGGAEVLARVEELMYRVQLYRGEIVEPKKWKAKANKVTTPDGRTFNLRVDEEREAFLAMMNGEES